MAATTGLVAVTLFIGACGSEEAIDNAGIVASPAVTAPSAPAAASPPASAPAADSSAASKGAAGRTDSKAESCRKAEKAKAELAKVLVGGAAGSAADYGKALAQLGTDLKAIAESSADPAVAKALQGVADTAAAVAAKKNPLTADQSAFGDAGGKLDAACAA